MMSVYITLMVILSITKNNSVMSDALVLSVAGALILMMATVIWWAVRKVLTEWADFKRSIILKLEVIQSEMSDLKAQDQLHTQYIHEVESRFMERITNLERRIEARREYQFKLSEKMHNMEKEYIQLKLMCNVNHSKK